MELNEDQFVLTRPALVGRGYSIEASENLASWSATASNIVAIASEQLWTAPLTNQTQFYRVVREQ